MRRRFLPILLIAGLAAPAAAAATRDKSGKRHSPGDVNYWAGIFDAEDRDEWQKPLAVIDFLGIQPGDRVADLGAGTGYFCAPLSIQVGDAGRLYAVDIQKSMLDHLMQREDVVSKRVVPVLAKPADPKLPEGEIDLILIVNTWPQIEKRERYLAKLEESLNPRGRVAVIDFHEGELPVGPPAEEKLSRDAVVAEFTDAGWHFTSESVALPYQFVLLFYPPAMSETPPILPTR